MNVKQALREGLTIKHMNRKKIPIYKELPGETPKQKIYHIVKTLRWEAHEVADALNISLSYAYHILRHH